MRMISSTLIAVFVLASCAIAPPQEIILKSNSSVETISSNIYRQANKCWARTATLWKDGVLVQRSRFEAGNVHKITISRYASDIGENPFVTVFVSEQDKKSMISVTEEPYFASIGGFTTVVVKWIEGSIECHSERGAP